MGNYSSAENYIESEIKRITGNSDTAILVLDHILQFEPKTYEFEPTHLGTLFAIDKNKDGKFDREELKEFAQTYVEKSLSSQSTDFQAQFKGYLTLLMWTDVSKEGGTQLFVDWFTKLFSENLDVHYFDSVPGIIFLSRDTIKTLHQSYGIDYQSFFDLMQRSAEHQGIMKTDEEFDDVVPLKILIDFAKGFITGFSALMKELGFEHELKVEWTGQ